LFALVSRVFVPYIHFITVNKHQKSVFFKKLQVRPLLEVNRLAKFVRLRFNVLCFILALFSLQWFILLNRTRSLLFFTFEMEGLLMGNYLFVKMNSSIVNRFLTIRTISKGKSLGRPPVSDERVEDLMKWWKRLYRYLGTKYSQYLSVWICSHTNSCTLCGGTMGAIIVPLLVLVLNNKYIIVGRSKAQLKLVSG
jgi:hypothetical protein